VALQHRIVKKDKVMATRVIYVWIPLTPHHAALMGRILAVGKAPIHDLG
jgi:hypothetical protein